MNQQRHISISESYEKLARAAAGEIAAKVQGAMKGGNTCSIVLSGGETPRAIYARLGKEPYSSKINWNRVHIFFCDERMVPPDDSASNYGMVRSELLGYINIPDGNIHRIHGELRAEEAARRYSLEIEKHFKTRFPRFDIVLLGIGGDGHTASLFPDTNALKEKQKNAVGVFVPSLDCWRVSLTLPIINHARSVYFIVSGSEKAQIVRTVFESALPSPTVPATMVQPEEGTLNWILDAAAASMINRQDLTQEPAVPK